MMVNYRKTFDHIYECWNELINAKYSDMVLGNFAEDTPMEEDPDNNMYDAFVISLLNYASKSVPSIINNDYPNCISLRIDSYGFSYMKDSIGFGIRTRYNRKTGEFTYTLCFSFAKDKAFLKFNPIAKYCMENGYEETCIESKYHRNNKTAPVEKE